MCTHVVGEEWEVELQGASGVREGPQGRPRREGRRHKERIGNEELEIFFHVKVTEHGGRSRLISHTEIAGFHPRQWQLRKATQRTWLH